MSLPKLLVVGQSVVSFRGTSRYQMNSKLALPKFANAPKVARFSSEEGQTVENVSSASNPPAASDLSSATEALAQKDITTDPSTVMQPVPVEEPSQRQEKKPKQVREMSRVKMVFLKIKIPNYSVSVSNLT